MKVKAIKMGYYNHVRIRPGTVFEMAEEAFGDKKDKDGKPALPAWVVDADAPSAKQKRLKLPGAKVVREPAVEPAAAPAPLHEAKEEKKDKGFFGGKKKGTGDSDVI